jgi:uncharacterized Ntn-hydrolase superfamily protein
MKAVATFSIVAHDPRQQEWGVAVQSKFLAVGAVVPWAQAGAGAVATQSYANLTYGPRGLELMKNGLAAEASLEALVKDDPGRETRQVGLVDRQGRAAAFTGAECTAWAGHQVGDGYACQGNILVSGTVAAMAAGFERARGGSGELADWLVAALQAGQEAGGDRRGRQAAAVLVVRQGGGYGGNNDRYLDLRVDDDPEPIQKLRELLILHHLFFGRTEAEKLVPLAGLAAELQDLLRRSGHYHGSPTGVFDSATRKALRALVGMENLEERWTGEGEVIDLDVIEFLRKKFPKNE